jgi:hypothetical protein
MEAPDGQDVGSVLDRMGDFSPCLLRLPIPRRLGFVPMFQGTCPGPSRRLSPKTTDKRFPLDHP